MFCVVDRCWGHFLSFVFVHITTGHSGTKCTSRLHTMLCSLTASFICRMHATCLYKWIWSCRPKFVKFSGCVPLLPVEEVPIGLYFWEENSVGWMSGGWTQNRWLLINLRTLRPRRRGLGGSGGRKRWNKISWRRPWLCEWKAYLSTWCWRFPYS